MFHADTSISTIVLVKLFFRSKKGKKRQISKARMLEVQVQVPELCLHEWCWMKNYFELGREKTWGVAPHILPSSPSSQTKPLLPELRLTCFLLEKGNAFISSHQTNTKTSEKFNFPYGSWEKLNLEALRDEAKQQQHPPADQSLPLHRRQWQMLRDWLFHPAALLVLCHTKTHRPEKD